MEQNPDHSIVPYYHEKSGQNLYLHTGNSVIMLYGDPYEEMSHVEYRPVGEVGKIIETIHIWDIAVVHNLVSLGWQPKRMTAPAQTTKDHFANHVIASIETSFESEFFK